MDISTELTPEVLALVPVIAGILQALKRIEAIAKLSDWLPFASLGLGVALCYAVKLPDPIMSGITVGLMASGAYSVLKKPSEKVLPKPPKK